MSGKRNRFHSGKFMHRVKCVLCSVLMLVMCMTLFQTGTVAYASGADEDTSVYTAQIDDETMEEGNEAEGGTQMLPEESEVTEETLPEPADPDAEETVDDAGITAQTQDAGQEDADAEGSGESEDAKETIAPEEAEEEDEPGISLLAESADEDAPATYEVTVVYFDENNDRITYSPAETMELTTGSVTTALEDASLQTRKYGGQEYKLDWVYNSNNLKVADVTYVKNTSGEWQVSYTLADNAIAGQSQADDLEIWYTYDDGTLPVSYSPSKTEADGSMNYIDGDTIVTPGSGLEFYVYADRGYSYIPSVTAGSTSLSIENITATSKTESGETVYITGGEFKVNVPAGTTDPIVVTAAYSPIKTVTFSPKGFSGQNISDISNNGQNNLDDVSKEYSEDGVDFTFEFSTNDGYLSYLQINDVTCVMPSTLTSGEFKDSATTTIIKDPSGDSEKDCTATISNQHTEGSESCRTTITISHAKEDITITGAKIRGRWDAEVMVIAGEGVTCQNRSTKSDGDADTTKVGEPMEATSYKEIEYVFGIEKWYKDLTFELDLFHSTGEQEAKETIDLSKVTTSGERIVFNEHTFATVYKDEGAGEEYQYKVTFTTEEGDYQHGHIYFLQLHLTCEPEKFNIEYELNGGTGTIKDDTVYTIANAYANVTLTEPTPPEGKLFYAWTTDDPAGKEVSDLNLLHGGQDMDLIGPAYQELMKDKTPTEGFDGTLTLYAVYVDELPEGTPGTAVVKTYLQDSTGAYAAVSDGDQNIAITSGQSLTVYDSYINQNPNVNYEYYTYNADISNPYLEKTVGRGDEIRLYYSLDFTGKVSIDDWTHGNQAADPAAWIEVTDESGTSSSETDSKVGSAYTQEDYVYYQANEDGSKGSQLSGKPTEAGNYIVEVTWTMTVTALDADDKQTQVTQTLTAQDTFTILESVNKTVTKIWDDASDQDGIRPDSISVQLYADGVAYGDPVTMSETGDEWTYTWKYLTRYNGDQEIAYTAKETEEIAGYTTSYSDDGLTITNTHTPETIGISGSKTWVDDNNRDGLRPESITVLLKADGDLLKTITVTEDDDWSWSVEDLPKYDAGEKISYKISEVTPDHYQVSYDDDYNITNTHQLNTTSISVSKAWKDNHDQDGIRPDSITVQLYADGKPVEDQTLELNESNDWTGTFSGVVLYEDQGEKIQYTVEEVEVPEGYEASVSQDLEDATSFTIINTHTPETYDIDVNKVWDDADNQDGVRPDEVTVTLYANGIKDASRVISADENGNWTCSFSDVPKYQNGEEITYTIVENEDDIEGYTGTVTGNAQDGFTIKNTHTPETIEIDVDKIWDDAEDQDGLRPDSITIRLLADGKQVDQVENLTPDMYGNWTWSFNDKPKYRDEGTKIVYTITEDQVEGYEPDITGDAENGFEIYNTHIPEMIDITGRKTWDDDNNNDGNRPTSITIRVKADGSQALDENGNEIFATVTEQEDWSWDFPDLPKYDAGKEISYTITEDAVSHYATGYEDSYNVVNVHTPDQTSLTVNVAWDDSKDQDGLRPASVTLKLLADGEDTGMTVVLSASNNWTSTFTGLEMYKDGNEVAYTVEEANVPDGYTVSVTGNATTGYTVKDTHTPETIEISGSKTWDDDENNDGDRPDSITIRLLADNQESQSLTVTAADEWSWNFTDLPKYEDGGNEIAYAITEDAVPYYSASYDGDDVINTHTPDQTSLTVTKVWDDKNDQDGIRPASVTVKLLADGEDTGMTVVLSASNHWKGSFTGLDMYEDQGEEIKYTVEETDVPAGYESGISGDAATGFTVTNTHTPETTEISGSKTWDDDNNNDGNRPSSITIRLKADGVDTDSVSVTAGDDWSWSFTNLPKYNAGKEITYTVTEDAVDHYATAYEGSNVTNTHTPDQTSLTVSAAWDDSNNQDGIRPDSVTVKLMADGEDTGITLELNASDNWRGTFTGLDLYQDQGEKIQYTVEAADGTDGYEVSVAGNATTGYTITFTHEVETIDISGSKTWIDENNNDGDRPDSITIRLLADGTEVDNSTVTPDENGDWSFTFAGYDKYEDEGTEIVYTITEDAVDNYSTSIDGYDVTNTHTPDQTSLTVTKVWEDLNDQDGIRPDSVTVKLLADGEDTGETLVLSEDNQWTGIFTGLDMYQDQGEKITYTVEETEVPDGYTAKVSGDATVGYTVTNTHETEAVTGPGPATGNPENGNPKNGNTKNGNPENGNPKTGAKTDDNTMVPMLIIIVLAAAVLIVVVAAGRRVRRYRR